MLLPFTIPIFGRGKKGLVKELQMVCKERWLSCLLTEMPGDGRISPSVQAGLERLTVLRANSTKGGYISKWGQSLLTLGAPAKAQGTGKFLTPKDFGHRHATVSLGER